MAGRGSLVALEGSAVAALPRGRAVGHVLIVGELGAVEGDEAVATVLGGDAAEVGHGAAGAASAGVAGAGIGLDTPGALGAEHLDRAVGQVLVG